ncbi:MAG: NUDIX domain-containing protein [Pyrinomonadaceae bacterium]|nr:NUDIX domain-containing protein [Pyrinomonadaceae bacterium]
MLKDLIGGIWNRFPRALRRMTMRVTHARFTVTAAAIVVDEQRRVLILRHRFRPGTGWGLPGGFIEAGEQPDEGVRRELREEVGLELAGVEVVATRAFKKPKQIEIVFRCRPKGDALPQSIEIRRASWFSIDSLPDGLPEDQRQLIKDTLNHGVKRAD